MKPATAFVTRSLAVGERGAFLSNNVSQNKNFGVS